MQKLPPSFQRHPLDGVHCIHLGEFPKSLAQDTEFFEELWRLHPAQFHEVQMHGRRLKTPRWQQAYGRDYQYSGSRNNSLPISQLLEPHWQWAKQTVDARLDGLLLNWYDGARGHYIGRHRDSTRDMEHGAPILTLSFGQRRTFRMRPWKGRGYLDFEVGNGSALLIPYATNLAWTHEVPASKKLRGRRISLTMRAFCPNVE